jgi:hypothetical protein
MVIMIMMTKRIYTDDDCMAPYGFDLRLAIGSTCDMRFWEILNDFKRYI